jgi:HK97 gp10 family phage protein
MEALDYPYMGCWGFFILAEFNMNLKVEVTLNPNWRDRRATIHRAIEIAARNVEKDAKARIAAWPAVDTGTTMNSIEAKPEGGFMRGENLAWRVGPVTEYAPFIEFGTIYMKARPFMIPALEGEAPRFKEAIAQLMAKL